MDCIVPDCDLVTSPKIRPPFPLSELYYPLINDSLFENVFYYKKNIFVRIYDHLKGKAKIQDAVLPWWEPVEDVCYPSCFVQRARNKVKLDDIINFAFKPKLRRDVSKPMTQPDAFLQQNITGEGAINF